MLIPKASHLVERVAERLLRSGALDETTAQLMQPGGAAGTDPGAAASGPAAPGAAGPETPELQPAAEPARRSALFAPPPPPMAEPAAAAPPPSGTGDAGTLPAYSPAPPTLGRTGTPGLPGAQAAMLDRPATPFQGVQMGIAAESAAGLLQGAQAVDALSLERAGMVDWSRTRTRISEEFRLVQRQILRSAFGPGAEPGFSNLLLVTSARPGEGKSFMATNLAGSIARQGDHHVLLVDADSKRDSICYSLGLAQARGLLDLAANPKLDPAPLIVRTPIERLSILPVGRERERSAELFSTKEMTRLIQSLGRRYADRLLVLDAPPCLSTSDPAVLAQVVGQILFVVEADRTQRDEIEASLDLIQACPTITLVLNKQQISSRYTFGAYSSYYSS
jgi:protein-tyrosine kinase